MGVGSIGGIQFTLDPESVAFHFDIKTNEVNTVGGKVVQVFGTRISDLVVTGSFGIAGWEYQKKWLDDVTAQMTQQIGQYTHQGNFVAGTPIRFTYPPRNWDFNVFLLDYSQPGSTSSVMLDNTIINPQWTLTLFPVVDNSGSLSQATEAALASYLSRLSAGIGWTPNQYNGPITADTTAQTRAGAANTSNGGTSIATTGGNGYGY